jgi:hypothetical protein
MHELLKHELEHLWLKRLNAIKSTVFIFINC